MHHPRVVTNRPDAPLPRRAPLAPRGGARRAHHKPAPRERSATAVGRCSSASATGDGWTGEDFLRAVEHAKLDAMKELAYGASHEINNPLANIAARAQTMLRRETDEDNRRMLAAIHRQAMRAHEMISDLMLFARPPRLEKQPTDLAGVVARVVEEVRPLAEERGITLTGPAGEAFIEASVDAVHLEVAVAALLTNSVEALDADGEIAVCIRLVTDDGVAEHKGTGAGTTRNWAEIEVADNGPGITQEVRAHLFDPFYSGREAGRGLGFGLSKCWRIVTEHGGRVLVDSAPGRGARFTLRLPGASVVE